MKRVLKNVFTAVLFFCVLIGVAQKDVSFDTDTISTRNDLPTQDEINTKMDQVNNDGWVKPVNTTNRATGPEQDCENGIVVCSSTYSQGTSYTGVGTSNEIPGSTCLGSSKEKNSVWYIVSPQVTGSFGFNIVTTKDYDFAMWDITADGCSTVGNSSPGPIRCNFSADNGTTGLDASSTSPGSLSHSASQAKIMDGLDVTAGNTYAILINNWSADATGYDLTFTGSATIPDATPPTISSVTASCSDNTITVTISEEILCSSIATNEFKLTNTRTSTDYFLTDPEIVSIAGSGCTSGSFTKTIIITHDGSLTSDPYDLVIIGTTLEDKCNNNIAAPATESFSYLSDITVSGITSFCDAGDDVTITITAGLPIGGGETIAWSPGIAATTSTVTANPTGTTTYTVDVTYGGCTKSTTHTATMVDNFIIYTDPTSAQICAGTATLTAYAEINGVRCTDCDFDWDSGTFTEANVSVTSWTSRPPGTYSVTATNAAGCAADNTGSATITLASAGSGATCNVLYVSPGGTGDGLTSSNPTDLESALTAALCSSTIIKCQVGTYNYDNSIEINSYVTVEGGYLAGFVDKVSDMASGNATTFVRSSTTPDGGVGTDYSMFISAASAENWRIQDVRIQMPSHTGGTGNKNYGIKIGTGNSGYKVVRCYIDAGSPG